MPWVPLDTHYLRDPKVQAAGSETHFALCVFPAILAAAKQVAKGGKVELTYRDLAHDLFIAIEEAKAGIDALVSADVLSCHGESTTVATTVAFKPATWRRWNDLARKTVERKSKAHG